MKTENLSTLKIHQMSKAQYNREEEAGNIDKHAIYITPDEEINLTPYATINYVDSKTYNNSVSIQNLKTYTDNALAGKSSTSHTHDSRYYTEGEVDKKLLNIQSQIDTHTRIHDSLVPNGTSIPENADLNTITYLKVGNYYCSQNKTVQTLKNCPLTVYNSSGTGTNGTAFMMQVYSPISPAIDNETNSAWVYRLRKITHYSSGVEYIQYCYVGGTAGENNWVYGDWYIKPRSKFTFNKTSGSTAAIGSTTQPIYINSSGDLTAGKALASGAYIESNVVKKPSGADTDAAVVTWSNNNSNLWFAPHPSFSTSNKFYLGRADGRTWDYVYASTGMYVGNTAVSLNGHQHWYLQPPNGGANTVMLTDGGNVYPCVNKGQQLGTSTNKWSYVLCQDCQEESDIRLKDKFDTNIDSYVNMLDLINPTSYLFKSDMEKGINKRNVGYIAQEVQEALHKVGLKDSDFAGLFYDEEEEKNGAYTYSLAYSQFIPILHAKVKQLEEKYNAKIEEYDAKIAELNEKIAALTV